MTKYSIKICRSCGTKFIPVSPSQRFCSARCRNKVPIDPSKNIKLIKKQNYCKGKTSDQPCWDCKNACGGCSWSKNLTPVKGWEAKIVKRKYCEDNEELNYTYKIISCPQFIRG